MVTSAEAQDSWDRSFSRVALPAYSADPRQCAQTVDQADIDFYLLAVSADQQQLRANAAALCQAPPLADNCATQSLYVGQKSRAPQYSRCINAPP